MKREKKQNDPVLEIIEKYGCQESNLIAILQDVQNEYKYLSEQALTGGQGQAHHPHLHRHRLPRAQEPAHL